MRRNELQRRGRRLRVSQSLTQLLGVLVTHASEVVTREQIAACLWDQPQYVGVTSGINTAMNRLRAILDDDPAKPVYIETVIGSGYRFIARVEYVADDPPREAPPYRERRLVGRDTEPVRSAGLRQNGSSFEAYAEPRTVASVEMGHGASPESEAIPEDVLVSEQTAHRVARSSPPASYGPPSEVPRSKTHRLVWISIISVLILLATAAAVFVWRYHPAGSARRGDIPWLSLAQQFNQQTFNNRTNRLLTAALSHDGKMVAFVDQSGISVRILDRNVDRLISVPSDLSVHRVTWSPSNDSLLVSGEQRATGEEQVWTVSFGSDGPKLLLQNAGEAVWSPDGRSIAFTYRQGAEIWLADAGGGFRHRLSAGFEQDRISSLLWSIDGKRLIYQRRREPTGTAASANPPYEEQKTYRWQYESIDARTGKTLATGDGLHFESAYLLSEGRLFFPKVDPLGPNTGAQLFMVRTDPATGRLLEKPHSICYLPGYNAFGISASDDGEGVALLQDRLAITVFVANLGPGPVLGQVRALNQSAPENYPHAWTPSGDAVIFESNKLGDFGIFRQKLDGSPAELLARSSGRAVLPQVTPDGKWILFENIVNAADKQIYRVPIDGGEPERVPTENNPGEFQCSVSSEGLCVLRQLNGRYMVYYALDAMTGRGRELGRTPWVEHSVGDWTISPDGTTVALPILTPNHPAIRLVTLGPLSQTRDVEVQGVETVLETTWAADSTSFYVETKDPTTFSVLAVDMEGKAKLLFTSKSPTWGVPSRDGRRIAFADYSLNRNLWIARKDIPPAQTVTEFQTPIETVLAQNPVFSGPAHSDSIHTN